MAKHKDYIQNIENAERRFFVAPVTIEKRDEEETGNLQAILTKDKITNSISIKKYKYTGFDGFLNSFLIPYAQPNMTAVLDDPDYPDQRNGRYVIDSVVTTFGVNGARRKVELGILVGENKKQTSEG